MSDCQLKNKIFEDMKNAMRAKEKQQLGAIRLILAAIKQKEVDERIELKDADVLQILDKMAKQRRDSIAQFTEADRLDLVEKEEFELSVIKQYLPEQLSDDELAKIVADVIKVTGAASMKDMGKVMGMLKPRVQGRADMGVVSKKIKEMLA